MSIEGGFVVGNIVALPGGGGGSGVGSGDSGDGGDGGGTWVRGPYTVVPNKLEQLQVGGARFDAGKSRVDLIPAEVLLLLGDVYEMGARKYDASNWRKGMKWSKVYGPLFRHLLKFWMGQKEDDESQKLHIMHVIWNAVALALYCIKPEYARFDDRQDPVNLVDMDEDERQKLYV